MAIDPGISLFFTSRHEYNEGLSFSPLMSSSGKLSELYALELDKFMSAHLSSLLSFITSVLKSKPLRKSNMSYNNEFDSALFTRIH